MIGEVIGNYRIGAILGQGGMGVVYRGEHVTLGRSVALKMLLPQLSSDAAIVQRFFKEARAASSIDHPGIVEIFDFGTHTDGRAYIVMSLLQGESLENRIRRGGPLPPMLGASLLAQAASALAAAHQRGIVHRDLKPDNIFLVPNEMMPDGLQVKLLDFGIAKLGNDQSSFKTQTGALIGTPAYMSPEQCMGASDLDHRTDIYSLGCILFAVLTGRPPFMSDAGTGMLIAAHLRDAPPDVRSLAQVPDPIAALVARCLAKEPAARFQTALELRTALVEAGAHAPTQPGQSVPRTPLPSQRFMGPDAYGETTAPLSGQSTAPVSGPPITTTTNSGAAAQLVHAQPAPKSKAPAIVGVVGLLAAILGVGVFVAIRGSGEAPASATATTPPPPPPNPPPITQDAAVEQVAKSTVDAAVEIAAVEPCLDGQERTADTSGHCCWRDQAWSSAMARCIGVPRCPSGTLKKGEGCEAVERAKQPVEIAAVTPTTPVQAVTTFTLSDSSVEPKGDVRFVFPARVASPSDNRSWVSISDANSQDSSYLVWKYVTDKAGTATLEAPAKVGTYEARLYTHYPQQAYNVEYRVKFTVAPLAEAPLSSGRTVERFSLADTSVAAGEEIQIVFPGPMIPIKDERYWITVVPAGAPDTKYDAWAYLGDKARSATLPAPSTPGAYQVRLHANYPKKSTNVVFRVPLEVK